MLNDEVIEKTILSSDFLAGGLLNPEQVTVFIQLIRKFSKLIPMSRNVLLDNPRQTIPKLHIGEPISQGLADFGGEDAEITETGKPLFNEITMDVQELISSWHVGRRSLRRNVSREALLQTVTDAMMAQVATDAENLYINGDTTLPSTTKLNKLLRVNDGVSKLCEGAHLVDWNGGYVSKALYAEMTRRLPEQYAADPGLRFIQPRAVSVDWMELNSQRVDAIGQRAFAGDVEAPFGIPIVEIPLVKSNKSLTVTEATSAIVVAITVGPFTIATGTNDVLKIDIDNAGVQTTTIPAGVFEVREIAKLINADQGLFVARDDGYGRLVIESPTTGSTSEVDIQTGSTAAATLGIDGGGLPNTVTGGDSGGTNTVYEGCELFLANPTNLIWAHYPAGTEVHTKFRQEKLHFETVVVQETDAQVENLDAVVKANNVRKRTV